MSMSALPGAFFFGKNDDVQGERLDWRVLIGSFLPTAQVAAPLRDNIGVARRGKARVG